MATANIVIGTVYSVAIETNVCNSDLSCLTFTFARRLVAIAVSTKLVPLQQFYL